MTRQWALLALVVMAATLPYLSTLNYGFVYDDHLTIEENPHLRLWPGLGRVLFTDLWSLSSLSKHSNYYRPVFLIAYEVVFKIAGPKPWAYHLLNVLLHAAATLMVFLLARRLWNADNIALIAALLFALHPGHVEAVAWIATLSELAYTLLLLIALYFYVELEPELWHFAIWLAAYAVALLCKESAIAFAPLAFAYDVFALRQLRWNRYAAITAVTLGYIGLRAFALGGLAPSVLYPNLSLTTQVLTAISNIGFYMHKVLLPINLSAVYDSEFVSSLNFKIATVAVLAALAAWKLRGKNAWCGAWFVISLMPVLGVSRIAVPLADRDLYLPSVGFVFLTAILFTRLGQKAAIALTAVVAIAYGGLTIYRLPAWRDDIPLFEQALKQNPESQPIRLLLASEFVRRGRFDEGLTRIDEVLERNPRSTEALANKAGLQVSMQDWPGVRSTCATTFSIDPNSSHCALCVAFADEQQGKLPEAREGFRRAFKLNPELVQALMHQGVIDARLGNLDAAQKALEEVARRSPTPPILNNLGTLYAQRGDMVKALNAFRSAVEADPGFTLARQNLERAISDTK